MNTCGDKGQALVLSKLAFPRQVLEFLAEAQPSGLFTAAPSILYCSIFISPDGIKNFFFRGRKLHLETVAAFEGVFQAFTTANHVDLMSFVDDLFICPGNTDGHFLRMCQAKKSSLSLPSGTPIAYIDSHFPFKSGNESVNTTIRSNSCQMLMKKDGSRCRECGVFRCSLRQKYSRWHQSLQKMSKFANNRTLTTPQRRKKLATLAQEKKLAARKISRMTSAIDKLISKEGVTLETDMHSDFCEVTKEQEAKIDELFPKETFKRIFWDQQLKAASLKSASGMRWHPLILRLALSLKMASSSAYHIMRTSGVIRLPSERTLRDYTHFCKQSTGFSRELNDQLVAEANVLKCDELQKHVILAFDEMKIRDDIVYNKHQQEMIGFVDLGKVNNELVRAEKILNSKNGSSVLERDVATSMLVIMVRGITTSLRFPWAHFPTTGVSASTLMSLMWEAVEICELLGFYVIGITSDGAGPNRKFYRMHGDSQKSSSHPLYKVPNKYSCNRMLYFFSDPPHLVKTTRNCLSHSFPNGKTRSMKVIKQFEKIRNIILA